MYVIILTFFLKSIKKSYKIKEVSDPKNPL